MIEITNVGYEGDEFKAKAEELAERLNCLLNKNSPHCLFVTNEKLALKIPSFSLLSADFSTHSWSKRKAEGKKQGLVRACKPVSGLHIIDATAGWGRDAAILASLGAEVLMIERNPIMAALLSDALARRSPTEEQEMKLSLHQGDAFSFLNALQPEDYPDVIYIDPMHPQRTKSALVKKDLQVLQELIGPDEDALELIKLAMMRVKQRVVVKWPQKIKSLLHTHTCVDGKTIRYDIYLKSVHFVP
jgi:16S rRNA (guanine1516-N2)-methyltransferase